MMTWAVVGLPSPLSTEFRETRRHPERTQDSVLLVHRPRLPDLQAEVLEDFLIGVAFVADHLEVGNHCWVRQSAHLDMEHGLEALEFTACCHLGADESLVGQDRLEPVAEYPAGVFRAGMREYPSAKAVRRAAVPCQLLRTQ